MTRGTRRVSMGFEKPLTQADDDSNDVTLTIEDSTSAGKTTWTMLLYLTDGCIGGETVFYPRNRVSEKEEVVIAPEAGMLLLHKHGDDCLLVS